MLKIHESLQAGSCWNKADPWETVFVLLGRDAAAPHAIREWIKERIRLKKNTAADAQLQAAEACATYMERRRRHAPTPRAWCMNCGVNSDVRMCHTSARGHIADSPVPYTDVCCETCDSVVATFNGHIEVV